MIDTRHQRRLSRAGEVEVITAVGAKITLELHDLSVGGCKTSGHRSVNPGEHVTITFIDRSMIKGQVVWVRANEIGYDFRSPSA